MKGIRVYFIYLFIYYLFIYLRVYRIVIQQAQKHTHGRIMAASNSTEKISVLSGKHACGRNYCTNHISLVCHSL